MLDFWTYGLRVHFKIINKGKVEWINNKLLYKAIRFIIPEFYSFIYSLINNVERLVY